MNTPTNPMNLKFIPGTETVYSGRDVRLFLERHLRIAEGSLAGARTAAREHQSQYTTGQLAFERNKVATLKWLLAINAQTKDAPYDAYDIII